MGATSDSEITAVTMAEQDPQKQSCAAAFNHSETARVVERDGRWHHLAVTWTAANNGLTQIFLDGAPDHTAQLCMHMPTACAHCQCMNMACVCPAAQRYDVRQRCMRCRASSHIKSTQDCSS